MASHPVTVSGNGPNVNPIEIEDDENATIIWTPASGLQFTSSGVTIDTSTGWPYGQPSALGNPLGAAYSITYINSSQSGFGTFSYSAPVTSGGELAALKRPVLEETPEIQNQGGGGPGLPGDKPKKK